MCRTVTSWLRCPAASAKTSAESYVTVCAVGRAVELHRRSTTLDVVKPLVKGKRLRIGIDDTPTQRYGPEVEGAGIHHHPSPGPAGEKHLYGHNWVTLAALAKHDEWGAIALPLQAQLYIRAIDVPSVPPERRPPFRTKLELAVQQVRVAETLGRQPLRGTLGGSRWRLCQEAVFASGHPGRLGGGHRRPRRGRPPVRPAADPTGSRAQRGPLPTYGKNRIYLDEMAADTEDWQQVECVQYGERVTKTIKTFLATWRPAGVP